MRRKLSLLIIAAFILALAVSSCSKKDLSLSSVFDEPLTFDLNDANLKSFKERLGTDDGYAFTVFYGGDTHGTLENCGCPNHPMGGLAWRVSYQKAFRQQSNKEAPMLFVDAGNLFTDDRYEAGKFPPEVLLKNRWVVKAYGDFLTDAANLSYVDLPYAAELFKKDGFEARVKELPFINKLISANVQPQSEALTSPVPYVIREVELKRGAAGKRLRIGIVGFTSLKPGEGDKLENAFAGFQIEDPQAAAKRVIPELQQKCDVIIALAHMSHGQAQRLASQNPEIHTVIAAQQVNGTEEARHFGSATLVFATNQTKSLGELRYYVKADGTIEKQVNRFVGLDKAMPEDPKALAMVNAAREEFTAEQKKNAAPVALQTVSSAGFVGSQKCADCHAEAYAVWAKSKHAHAMLALENKSQQFDNECVKCHVVGFEKGGFQSMNTTPQLANVQCEACHGPGNEHIKKPAKGFGKMVTPTACIDCHTQPNSPDFEFTTYWEMIKH